MHSKLMILLALFVRVTKCTWAIILLYSIIIFSAVIFVIARLHYARFTARALSWLDMLHTIFKTELIAITRQFNAGRLIEQFFLHHVELIWKVSWALRRVLESVKRTLRAIAGSRRLIILIFNVEVDWFMQVG